MIDHVGIRVRNLRASTEFYRTALAPLGYEVLMDFDFGVGLGRDRKPDLWLYPGEAGGVMTHVALDYGAFVTDPDGHNLEAVCHLPA